MSGAQVEPPPADEEYIDWTHLSLRQNLNCNTASRQFAILADLTRGEGSLQLGMLRASMLRADLPELGGSPLVGVSEFAGASPIDVRSEYDPERWEGAGEKTRKKKKGSKETELDKYALLGLSKERFLATEAMIKNGEYFSHALISSKR
eukprot:911083-Prorocentrum_minimum.AAC.3